MKSQDLDADLEILQILRNGAGTYVSGEQLCNQLSVSRMAIWKRINKLRSLGYEIDARTNQGYLLKKSPDLLIYPEIAPLLKTDWLGRHWQFVPKIDSTSLCLEKMVSGGAPEGVVVVADQQTAGRGRMGRTWFSPPRCNIYCSFLLRPKIDPPQVTSLPLLIGLAVTRSIRNILPDLEPKIKWPNDIQIDGRKICGILCDMQAEMDQIHHVIIGFGMNVNIEPTDLLPEIAQRATSLRIVAGKKISRVAILASILNTFEELYKKWLMQGLNPFMSEFQQHDVLRGRQVELEQFGRKVSGVGNGIGPDGALVLQMPDGSLTNVISGDVHITRMG